MARVSRIGAARIFRGVVASTLLGALLAGCSGTTSVEPGTSSGPVNVAVSLDPMTLKPPQTGSITYTFTDPKTGKPFQNFLAVSGAILHNVLISGDLLNFRHTYARELVQNSASVFTYFPAYGTYKSYGLFQPEGASPQVVETKITTEGATGSPAALVEDTTPRKTQGWLQFTLARDSAPVKKGVPTQLALFVSERGRPVTALWPYLGAAGQIWLVDEKGENFAHYEAAAKATAYLPASTVPAAGATETPAAPEGAPVPAPTFAAGVKSALDAASAQPVQPLSQVQQTPQSSILGTPEVLPMIGYGPELAFTHTFPHAGMYKIWLEVLYRGQVVVVDYTIRVVD